MCAPQLHRAKIYDGLNVNLATDGNRVNSQYILGILNCHIPPVSVNDAAYSGLKAQKTSPEIQNKGISFNRKVMCPPKIMKKYHVDVIFAIALVFTWCGRA